MVFMPKHTVNVVFMPIHTVTVVFMPIDTVTVVFLSIHTVTVVFMLIHTVTVLILFMDKFYGKIVTNFVIHKSFMNEHLWQFELQNDVYGRYMLSYNR